MPTPNPPLSDWVKLSSGPLANQNFSLAPSAPISLRQKFAFGASAPLKSQHHLGGGDPPTAPLQGAPPCPRMPRGVGTRAPHAATCHTLPQYDHNMWNYLYFLHHLRIKPPEDFTGQESYVHEMVQRKDISFFPLNKSLTLMEASNQSQEEDSTVCTIATARRHEIQVPFLSAPAPPVPPSSLLTPASRLAPVPLDPPRAAHEPPRGHPRVRMVAMCRRWSHGFARMQPSSVAVYCLWPCVVVADLYPSVWPVCVKVIWSVFSLHDIQTQLMPDPGQGGCWGGGGACYTT